jgi:hypothetical protein
MNVLVRLLRNPSFATYVTEQQPTLAGLVQMLRTQPEVARGFGIGEFLDGTELSPELETDPLAKQAGFVFLPVSSWQQLVANLPLPHPPPGGYSGTWQAGLRLADRVAILPDAAGPEPELMLYVFERREDRISLDPVRIRGAYQTVDRPFQPCKEEYELDGEILRLVCDNQACTGTCQLRYWIEDDVENVDCYCPPDPINIS